MEHAPLSLEHVELSPRTAGELLSARPDDAVAVACGRVSDGRVAVRRNAVLLLSLLDPLTAPVVEQLEIARKDADPIVRRHAVSAFASAGVAPEVALRALIRALNDDDEGVAQLASDGLERVLAHGRPATWRYAVDLLAEGSFAILIRATTIFRRLGERAIVTLVASLAHGNGYLRRWARETVQSFGAAAIPVLIDALERPPLREAATRTLEGAHEFDDSHMQRVAELIGHAEPELQAAAFRVLAAMQKEFARRKQRLADVPHPEFYVRSLSDKQIAGATEGVTAEALLWNLRDGRWYVKTNTITLLAHVTEKSDPLELIEAALKPLARDADAPVRLAVATHAARILKAEAAGLLIEIADDGDPEVAEAARAQLAAIAPRALRALIRALGTARSPGELGHALDAIVGVGGEALSVLLEQVLRSPAPLTRAAAIEGLVRLQARGPLVRGALIGCLEDAHERVRAAAAQALGELFRRDDEVIAALRACAAAETVLAVRRAAAIGAERVAGKEKAPKVKAPAELPSEDFGKKPLSFKALEKAVPPLELLRPLTTDGRALVRHNAALGLGLHPEVAQDEDLVRWLVVALKDAEVFVRAAAARAIGRLKPPALHVVPPLAETLIERIPVVEAAALDALVAFGRGALGPMLDALAERAHPTDEELARIARHLPDELVEPLAHYLHRPARYGVRGLAADLLAAMGERAAAAWSDLAKAVEEPLGQLRVRVVRAIGAAGPPSIETYETLLVIGNYDSRASVRSAIEEAVEVLVGRVDPEAVEEAGGHAATREAWLREVTGGAARPRVQRAPDAA